MLILILAVIVALAVPPRALRVILYRLALVAASATVTGLVIAAMRVAHGG